MITKDKKEVWLGQHVQLIIEDDQIVGFHALARDISERKWMEEALKAREKKFQVQANILKEGNIALKVLLQKKH
jgi:PAS domain-containing protein